MLCLPSIISLCLLLILDNLRYTVCCLGLARDVMIVLVLIVVIWIMTSGTMGITSRHRQAETESQNRRVEGCLREEVLSTVFWTIFLLSVIKNIASHLHCRQTWKTKLDSLWGYVWVPSVFTLDSYNIPMTVVSDACFVSLFLVTMTLTNCQDPSWKLYLCHI